MNFQEIAKAPFPGQRMWVASENHLNFIILLDGLYTASTKLNNKVIHIVPYDMAVRSFDEAKSACESYSRMFGLQ